MNMAYSRKTSSHLIRPNDEIPIQVFSFIEGKQKSKLGGVMRAVKYRYLHMLIPVFRSFHHFDLRMF